MASILLTDGPRLWGLAAKCYILVHNPDTQWDTVKQAGSQGLACTLEGHRFPRHKPCHGSLSGL